MKKFIPRGVLPILAGAVLTLSSCSSSQTTLPYFTNIDTVMTESVPSGDYAVTIQPGDELFISVTSLVPEATAPYNLPVSNPAKVSNLKTYEQPRQTTYIVNDKGDITMPVIGTLHVAGMTTLALEETILKKVQAEVEDPVVKVTLLNFRVNVLGEVNAPRSIPVSHERYSLLDALADAGDLSPYGERERVILIREENGRRDYHVFNLNDAATLQSPYFYLQQNDVIYVEPNNIRRANAKYNQNNAYKISVISTIVSACSVVASLVIALTVK